MRRVVTILFLTSLLAAADNSLVVRKVSVTGSNTYTLEGAGFSPKKGSTPVVTINGRALTVSSFTNTSIVGSLATPVTGDYTVKITTGNGQSIVYKVAEPPQKEDSGPVNAANQGANVAAYYTHGDAAFPASLPRAEAPSQTNSRGCDPTAAPGVSLPPLPAFCDKASDGKNH
jgi:hypothetical protein